MKGMRFTRNRQNTRSFGKFLAGNPTRPSAPVACVDRSSQVTPNSVSRSETCRGIVFKIEIPCILLILMNPYEKPISQLKILLWQDDDDDDDEDGDLSKYQLDDDSENENKDKGR